MHNDRFQGILFDQPMTVDFVSLSTAERRRLLIKNLVNKYRLPSLRPNKKPVKPVSPYVVFHRGPSRNAELGELLERFKK